MAREQAHECSAVLWGFALIERGLHLLECAEGDLFDGGSPFAWSHLLYSSLLCRASTRYGVNMRHDGVYVNMTYITGS
jgi:hypothetical protein